MQKRDCRKQAYFIVEKMLRNREDIVRAVAEMREAQQGLKSAGIGSQSGIVSDPTGKEAVKAVTPIPALRLELGRRDELIVHRPETWIEAMNILYDECPAIEKKAMLYFYGGHSAVDTALEIGMDESTVYRIRSEFRHMMTEIACQFGLVYVTKVKEKPQGCSP